MVFAEPEVLEFACCFRLFIKAYRLQLGRKRLSFYHKPNWPSVGVIVWKQHRTWHAFTVPIANPLVMLCQRGFFLGGITMKRPLGRSDLRGALK